MIHKKETTLMAVTKNLVDKKLAVRFDNGTTASGAKSLKAVNFSNVLLDATDEDLYAAGTAYAALTTRILEDICVTDVNRLTSGQ